MKKEKSAEKTKRTDVWSEDYKPDPNEELDCIHTQWTGTPLPFKVMGYVERLCAKEKLLIVYCSECGEFFLLDGLEMIERM